MGIQREHAGTATHSPTVVGIGYDLLTGILTSPGSLPVGKHLGRTIGLLLRPLQERNRLDRPLSTLGEFFNVFCAILHQYQNGWNVAHLLPWEQYHQFFIRFILSL